MIKNYLKTAWRSLAYNKVSALINIGGLTVGMGVAILVGLWIHDEVTYNSYHKNHKLIAKVWQHATFNNEVATFDYLPFPLAAVLHSEYKNDFSHVVMSTFTSEHVLGYGDRKFTNKGNYMEADAPEMFTLNMLKGTQHGLNDPSSIMLSASVAKALFGNDEPLNKIIKIDNKLNVTVTGVYEDLPLNSDLSSLEFIAPWNLYVSSEGWIKNVQGMWDNNNWQIYVQLNPNADFEKVSAKIKNVKVAHAPETAVNKFALFLNPMDRWHLYSEWDKNGLQANGRIQYVWLFGFIAFFVLLLACINFMNLSTARSEKRAKEVGIRKTVGSNRVQLVIQFFCESLLVSLCAFFIAIVIVQIVLPWFNSVAGKNMGIPWENGFFWLAGMLFCLITGLVAGSYPALYLSSFRPIGVLKGTFRIGRMASVPRKVLVVLQFTSSVILIVGTIVVFQQIQYAKNRPIGYSREGLISVNMNTPDLHSHYNALHDDLLKTGAVAEMAMSTAETTNLNSSYGGFNWEGKDPNFQSNFGYVGVSHEFGKTVGWQFTEGRDFSRQYPTDSLATVINEAAVKYIGLKNPVGKILQWNGRNYTIIGVIKDMVMDSPYDPIYQTVFMLNYNSTNTIDIKINPKLSARDALAKIAPLFQRYNPGSPFDFKFASDEYSVKFASEERIGTLALLFSGLAVFISCLGIFGLASFVAEKRTKEIGVRKVLGASVLNLWGMLSKDFVLLVVISCWIATPVAYYYMNQWLGKFNYHAQLSWWVFVATGFGALLITLLTVSFQAVKAALMNPVKSLRTE